MNILILGLGQYPQGSGVTAALHFARQKHRVTVADFYYTPAMEANVKRLKKCKNVRFVFNRHDLKAVREADLIVKHQRIRMDEPEVREALKRGISLESELSIFLKHCPAKVIGVTGTRGKSTTTALIHAMLSAGTRRTVWLGGNILVSPLTFLSKIKKEDLVVLEMSSFQLEGTGFAGVSPQIAVWTNLMNDHLNAYPSMDEYAEAKAQIFRHQKPNDVVFLPVSREFDGYAKEAPGRVVRVGKEKLPKLQLLGEHNMQNARFAVAVARELGVKSATIQNVLKNFKGLPNRLELVATKNGVRYVNDSAATTPDATIVALRAISPSTKSIHLIAGGADKELEFDEVAKEIKKRKVCVALFEGTAHKKFAAALTRQRVKFETVRSMREALAFHRSHVKTGETILLSPGCASFGLFKNEFDRGAQFPREIKRQTTP